MALSFILGNLVGRAMISYVLVWLVCWLSTRLSWRAAFARSVRWYGILTVAMLTLLGVGEAIVRGGGLR